MPKVLVSEVSCICNIYDQKKKGKEKAGLFCLEWYINNIKIAGSGTPRYLLLISESFTVRPHLNLEMYYNYKTTILA